MLQSIFISKRLALILSCLLSLCLYKCLYSNDGPTLLKKSEKKEKLREEDLVIKKIYIKDLTIKKDFWLKYWICTKEADGLDKSDMLI